MAEYTNLFEDENEGHEDELETETEANKELLIFLVDGSSSMLEPGMLQGVGDEDGEEGVADVDDFGLMGKSHLAAVLNVVEENLKIRIISKPDDEVALVFFNTRQKKNVHEKDGVYVMQELEVPSAHLIRSVAQLSDNYESLIGSGPGAVAGAPNNPLKPPRSVDRRVFLFTTNDDPFGEVDTRTGADMRRLTIQKAKDIQDLGVVIELLPLSLPGEEFNVRILYAEMVLVDDSDDASTFLSRSVQRLDSLRMAMRRKRFKKRMVRRVGLRIGDTEIAMQTYACIRTTRPAVPLPLCQLSTSYICQDTGAVLTGPMRKSLQVGSAKVLFTPDEIREVKKVTGVELRLIGFKPLRCLKEWHNLLPPTFLYPDEQAEIVDEAGQLDPPGFQMIPLPFEDDIRPTEQYHLCEGGAVRADSVQVEAAMELVHSLTLKHFDLLEIENPALQTHYSALQGMALEEESPPPVHDATLPNYKNMAREKPLRAVMSFKDSVFGVDFDAKEAEKAASIAEKSVAAANKRKAQQDESAKKAGQRDWMGLAKEGKLSELTTEALKDFLRTKNLQVSGKKEVLIVRILTALGL